MATPPGVPADRLARLRALFAEVVADPDFRREALGVDAALSWTSGEDYAVVLARILHDYADIQDMLAAALDCGQQIAETGVPCTV